MVPFIITIYYISESFNGYEKQDYVQYELLATHSKSAANKAKRLWKRMFGKSAYIKKIDIINKHSI
jgi:hypothetical protein